MLTILDEVLKNLTLIY